MVFPSRNKIYKRFVKRRKKCTLNQRWYGDEHIEKWKKYVIKCPFNVTVIYPIPLWNNEPGKTIIPNLLATFSQQFSLFILIGVSLFLPFYFVNIYEIQNK